MNSNIDFKNQATLLHELLLEYFPLWSQEVMNEYPKTISSYPTEWIAELNQMSTEELFQIDSKQSFDNIKGTSLKKFMARIQNLSHIEQAELHPEIPLEDWAFIGVKFKKRHEIQKIVSKIKTIYQKIKFHHVNDIGGGVGHLSRILAHYHSIPTFSVDQNKEFQDIGQKRMERFRKIENAAEVTFINMKFGDNKDHNLKIFTQDSFSLGLHTCGNLAVKLIEENIKHETLGLLSFGCCYYRMKKGEDFPISDFYKKNNFQKINLYGLSLATRSHAETDYANYLKKEKVKYYRYGLHLFLMKNFNRNDLVDIGECPLHVYDEPFSQYVLMKLKELNLPHSFDNEYIDNFFYSAPIRTELRTMYLCNIIRWQLGRALEVFILLDRCLLLSENGYDVDVRQYFKEALSPRNIGILGIRKGTSRLCTAKSAGTFSLS